MPSSPTNSPSRDFIGPVLFFRGWSEEGLQLAALIVNPDSKPIPKLTAEGIDISPELLYRSNGWTICRYEFMLDGSGGKYKVGGETFRVAGVRDGSYGDLNLAYVSCNGQECGDRERSLEERNAMWQRLAQQHAAEPFQLLLQGGDQLYADEMLNVHPAVSDWRDGARDQEFDESISTDIARRLRAFLLDRYLELYRQSAPAQILASVPTLCMWDDHDICDGWGSIPIERMNSPIGRLVFDAAREMFLLFQLGSRGEDLPAICLDPTGATLSWAVRLPGVVLLGPDLRSERQPTRVIGPAGWEALNRALDEVAEDRVFVLSSVPVLGPRLSWIERILHRIPGAQKYEDDLRDQWQSRSHRKEWRKLLRALLVTHERATVTLLSGEIHLATRCTMISNSRPIHQLIASGISHPPPPAWYGRALGALARFGESPLKGHRIQLHALPGQRTIYTAQRNYLIVRRRDKGWTACWELEETGTTPTQQL